MQPPEFVHLKNGDNRVVPLTMWMAKDLLEMLQDYLEGESPAKTPCYAAGQHDLVKDFGKLIELAEKNT